MAAINDVNGIGHAIEVRTSRGQRGRFGTIRVTTADAARMAEMSDEMIPLVYSGPLLVRGVRQVVSFAVEIVEITRSSPMLACVQFQERGPLASDRRLARVH